MLRGGVFIYDSVIVFLAVAWLYIEQNFPCIPLLRPDAISSKASIFVLRRPTYSGCSRCFADMKYPLSSNNSENLKLLRRKLVECSTKVSIPIWDLEYFRIFGGRYNGIMLKFSHYSSVTVRDRPLMYYGSNRKSGSKGQNSGFPPYFYFRFDCYRPWTLVFSVFWPILPPYHPRWPGDQCDLDQIFFACCQWPWPSPPPGWRNPKGKGQFWRFSSPMTVHYTA